MFERFIFDAIIAVLVAAIPLYLVRSVLDARRRKGSGPGPLSAILLLFWTVIVYGSFIEPRLLVTRTYGISLDDGPRTLTVAVVSDTHLGGYRHREWLAKVVAAINAAKPDLVLLAGDYVSSAAGLEEFAPFADLEAPLGVYAALGNWDYRVGAVDVRHRIESYGVEVLTNEAAVVRAGDAELAIVGLDDTTFGTPDIDRALEGVPWGVPVVVLAHNPDVAPLAESRGADLVVAGHTHGGQVRLPGYGAVPRLPIHIDQSFDRGLFAFGPTMLFITSGVGESGARARLLAPPEVSVLRIRF